MECKDVKYGGKKRGGADGNVMGQKMKGKKWNKNKQKGKKRKRMEPDEKESTVGVASCPVSSRENRLPMYFTGDYPSGRFVVPGDTCFKELLTTSYKGFVVEPPQSLDAAFKDNFAFMNYNQPINFYLLYIVVQ